MDLKVDYLPLWRIKKRRRMTACGEETLQAVHWLCNMPAPEPGVLLPLLTAMQKASVDSSESCRAFVLDGRLVIRFSDAFDEISVGVFCSQDMVCFARREAKIKHPLLKLAFDKGTFAKVRLGFCESRDVRPDGVFMAIIGGVAIVFDNGTVKIGTEYSVGPC